MGEVEAADWGVSVNSVLPGLAKSQARGMAGLMGVRMQNVLGKGAVKQSVQPSGQGISNESKATRVGLNQLRQFGEFQPPGLKPLIV